MNPSRRGLPIDAASVVVAGLLLLLVVLIGWDTSRLGGTTAYGIGPHAMPALVGTGLAVLAIANLIQAQRGNSRQRETGDIKGILLILGSLAAMMVLVLFGAGFIPGIAILFAVTSRAFGRRAFLADLAIGLTLGIAVFLLFSKLLALSLPMGWIESLF